MVTTLIAIVLASILFSAFFSGMEIAYVSSNKLRIELQNKQGDFASRLLSHLMARPGRFIATMLVGNNIALVVYGIFMARWMEPLLSQYLGNEVAVLLAQTLLSTFLILIMAEYIPQSHFRPVFKPAPPGIRLARTTDVLFIVPGRRIHHGYFALLFAHDLSGRYERRKTNIYTEWTWTTTCANISAIKTTTMKWKQRCRSFKTPWISVR